MEDKRQYEWPYGKDMTSFWADVAKQQKPTALDEARALAEARMGVPALRELAERSFPLDFEETARRWGMATIMRELWVRGYMTGWRDAFASEALRTGTNEGDPNEQ